MRKRIYFDRWRQYGWPAVSEIKPYFIAQKGREWFYAGGNDSAGIYIEGIDGTEHLDHFTGRKDVSLQMWGNPEHGVFVMYQRGVGPFDITNAYCSKGDMSRLGELVYSLHDTPLPVGLYIPFAKAWLAVKEFMETEGQLPKSIEWVRNRDLPPNTFPDP